MMPEVEIPVLSDHPEYHGRVPRNGRARGRKSRKRSTRSRGREASQLDLGEGFHGHTSEFELRSRSTSLAGGGGPKINAIRATAGVMKEPVIQKLTSPADAGHLPLVGGPEIAAARADRTGGRKVKAAGREHPGRRPVRNSSGSFEPRGDGQPWTRPGSPRSAWASTKCVPAWFQNVTPAGRLTLAPPRCRRRSLAARRDRRLRVDGHQPARHDPIRLSTSRRSRTPVEEQRSLALIDGSRPWPSTSQADEGEHGGRGGRRTGGVDQLAVGAPADVEIQIVRDSSWFHREAVADVQMTLVLGPC